MSLAREDGPGRSEKALAQADVIRDIAQKCHVRRIHLLRFARKEFGLCLGNPAGLRHGKSPDWQIKLWRGAGNGSPIRRTSLNCHARIANFEVPWRRGL